MQGLTVEGKQEEEQLNQVNKILQKIESQLLLCLLSLNK